NAEPDEPDKKLIAFVVVDLGQRIGQLSQALEVAAPFLNRLEDPAGFSFTEACVDANRLDLLEQFARENDDILSMATVLLTRKAD
ncbi:MAG: hypothetical protein KDA91_01855, partial [Planctomycetaceae bacterium]|nr:hypothetical protein [Planctomycetaceae bacterium]